MELTVKKAFIDKNDKGKIYKVGETLHTDELNRVNDLVARGFCVIKSLESKQTEKVTFQGNEYDLNVVRMLWNPSMPLLPKMPGLRV